MTATRDRPSDLDEESAEPAWDERPIIGNRRGLPWWGAVLLAFGLATAAAWIDIHRQDSLGRIYQVAYVIGCLAAVALVRRRNLFGPMVQPPLVFAVTAIGAVVLNQPGPLFSSGVKQLVLSVALPLTSNFPTMAVTTGATVAVGLFRLWRQRDPNPSIRPSRRAQDPLGALDDRPGRGTDRADAGSRRPRDRAGLDRSTSGRPRPDRSGLDRSGLDRPEQSAGRRSSRGRAEPDPGRTRQRGSRDPDRLDRPNRAEGREQGPRMGRGRTDPPSGDRPVRGDRRSASQPDPDRRRQPRDPGQRRTERPDPEQPRRPTRRRPPPDDYR